MKRYSQNWLNNFNIQNGKLYFDFLHYLIHKYALEINLKTDSKLTPQPSFQYPIHSFYKKAMIVAGISFQKVSQVTLKCSIDIIQNRTNFWSHRYLCFERTRAILQCYQIKQILPIRLFLNAFGDPFLYSFKTLQKIC